jgi:hypothetical protein
MMKMRLVAALALVGLCLSAPAMAEDYEEYDWAIAPVTLYAATETGLFASQDGGVTWTLVQSFEVR